jgi:hypothetical protein
VAMESEGMGNRSNAGRAQVATRYVALLALGSGLLSAVLHAQPAYDAQYISETVPSQIEPLTSASASITMQNTGTATWIRGDVFLSTQDPQDNYYWCIQNNQYGMYSGNRVLIPNDVAPNEQVTFNFDVVPLSCRFAAASPFVFRMLSQTHGTFGQETPDPGVIVATATVFVSQQVPAMVPAGATVLVTETFTNTTTTTWQVTDGYTLGPAGPTGNTTWGVSPVPLPVSVAPNANVTFIFYAVAPTTVGTYNFQWQMNMPNGTPFGSVSPATSVQVIAAGPPNYEGLWWTSPAGSESGWGINFAHQGNTIFATWFTYDLTGNAWWLSMTAQQTATGTYAGTLFQNTGPPYNSATFNPALVTSTSVGSGTLTFTDLNDGTFAYTVTSTSGTTTQTKNITREVFGQLPTCTFGIFTDLTVAYNYQDLWWASPAGSQAGWGVNLTQQGTTIFATWFTYNLDGTPLWLSVTAPLVIQGTYSGILYQTTGPAFNSVPFLPADVTATAVGTATFTFTDGNTGTFAFNFGAVSQSVPITREVFVAPGTVCQ